MSVNSSRDMYFWAPGIANLPEYFAYRAAKTLVNLFKVLSHSSFQSLSFLNLWQSNLENKGKKCWSKAVFRASRYVLHAPAIKGYVRNRLTFVKLVHGKPDQHLHELIPDELPVRVSGVCLGSRIGGHELEVEVAHLESATINEVPAVRYHLSVCVHTDAHHAAWGLDRWEVFVGLTARAEGGINHLSLTYACTRSSDIPCICPDLRPSWSLGGSWFAPNQTRNIGPRAKHCQAGSPWILTCRSPKESLTFLGLKDFSGSVGVCTTCLSYRSWWWWPESVWHFRSGLSWGLQVYISGSHLLSDPSPHSSLISAAKGCH